jgi:probable HAF family extracellular repeat protein
MRRTMLNRAAGAADARVEYTDTRSPIGLPLGQAAAALVLLASALASGQQRYEVTNMGFLPDTHSNVPFAINNAGEAVGWCQGPQAQLHAYLYTPGGGLAELPPPPGFTESRAADIANNGIVVGGANTGLGTTWSAWRLQDGVYTVLPQFPDGCAGMVATDVNSSGQLVGYTCPDGGLEGPRAFFYSDAAGLIDLTVDGIARAEDINEAGVVTGQSLAGPAFRWTLGGGLELIGTLPPPYDDYAVGLAINDSGHVTGFSAQGIQGSDPWRAFVFTDETGMVQIGPDQVARSAGRGINEAAHVAGNSGPSGTPDRDAFLWTPADGRQDLTGVFVGDPEFVGYRSAWDINDSGQIVAQGDQLEPPVPSAGVILTPVEGCAADFNADGVLDLFDFLAFTNAFNAGEPAADCTGDAVHDLFDFLCFVNAFNAGC